MAEGSKLGFVIFYVVYIAIIVMMSNSPMYNGGLYEGETPSDIGFAEFQDKYGAEPPEGILEAVGWLALLVIASIGVMFGAFGSLLSFSISIWWLGFINVGLTLGFLWVILEFARGSS